MKKCTKCNTNKPLSDFNFKNKNKKEYQPRCTTCSRSAGKLNYNKNKNKIIKINNARSKNYREINRKWKSHLECSICNEKSQSCIEFHHIAAENKINIVSKIMSSATLPAVLKEAKKCAVVCANCHRKIHANELELTVEHEKLSKKMINSAYYKTTSTEQQLYT